MMVDSEWHKLCSICPYGELKYNLQKKQAKADGERIAELEKAEKVESLFTTSKIKLISVQKEDIDRLTKQNKILEAESIGHEHLKQAYYRIMGILRNLNKYKNKHGKCNPRKDRACTYCNAEDDLKELVADYKGPPIILASPTSSKGG